MIELCLERELASALRADGRKELEEAVSINGSSVDVPLNLLNWDSL